MKFLFEIILLTLAIGCTVGEPQRCTKQSDCKIPEECCSKRMGILPIAQCVKRRQLDEICLEGAIGQTMVNGTYDITCPCALGLECIKPVYYDDFGTLIYTRNPTCQKIGYEQPPLEFYTNQINGVYGYGSRFRPGAYVPTYRKK